MIAIFIYIVGAVATAAIDRAMTSGPCGRCDADGSCGHGLRWTTSLIVAAAWPAFAVVLGALLIRARRRGSRSTGRGARP